MSAVPSPGMPPAVPGKAGDRTDSTPQGAYIQLREDRPELFATPPGDGAITIPGLPGAEGEVLHHDRWWMLLRDQVTFPDGRHGTYLRMLAPLPGVAVLPLLGSGSGLRVVLIEQFRHATRSWHWEIPRGGGTDKLSDASNAAKELAEEIGATPRELTPLGAVHPDTGILGQPIALYAARVNAVGDPARAEGIRQIRTVTADEAEQLAQAGEITDTCTIAALFRARRAGLLA
ncbi:NUDIX domain-containing protein [Streptomyces sp. CA-106110]|uniref:NUDIX domain-containing protein n=1 Tax=Streptomyces sp. CA-106110 TaxID=3240044 RepID=UPI003D8E2EC0